MQNLNNDIKDDSTMIRPYIIGIGLQLCLCEKCVCFFVQFTPVVSRVEREGWCGWTIQLNIGEKDSYAWTGIVMCMERMHMFLSASHH